MQTTIATGSFIQGETGTFLTDVDFDPARAAQFTDRIDFTGSVVVGGKIVVNLDNVQLLQSGTRSSILIDPPTSITDAGVQLVAPNSAIASFALVFGQRDLSLLVQADFAGLGRTLNVNQTAVGDYFNRIQAAGSSAALASTINQLFSTTTAAQLGAIYDSYGGAVYADQIASATSSADRLGHAMRDCDRTGLASADGCVWLSAGGSRLKFDANGQNLAYRDEGGFVGFGGEHRLGDTPVLAGGAFMYEKSSDRSNGSTGSGERYQGGLTLKYRGGHVDLAAFGSYGRGRYDASRPVLAPGGVAISSGHSHYTIAQAGGELGYAIGVGTATLRPAISASHVWYDQDRFSENGAGPLSLTVGGSGGVTRANGMVELTAPLSIGGLSLQPSLKGGYTRLFDPAVGLQASFAGAPATATPFTTTHFLDRSYGTVDAGVTAQLFHGGSLRLDYTGAFARSTRAQTAKATVIVRF